MSGELSRSLLELKFTAPGFGEVGFAQVLSLSGLHKGAIAMKSGASLPSVSKFNSRPVAFAASTQLVQSVTSSLGATERFFTPNPPINALYFEKMEWWPNHPRLSRASLAIG
jgi:hypothetical protein